MPIVSVGYFYALQGVSACWVFNLEKGKEKMGKLANDMMDGFCCSHCGIYFQYEHGHPVLCANCYDRETEDERAGIQRATIEEM